MAEPTNQDVLDALGALTVLVGGTASAEQVEQLDRKVDELRDLVVQGFASLGVQEARRTGTGDD